MIDEENTAQEIDNIILQLEDLRTDVDYLAARKDYTPYTEAKWLGMAYAPIQRYECTHCHSEFTSLPGTPSYSYCPYCGRSISWL